MKKEYTEALCTHGIYRTVLGDHAYFMQQCGDYLLCSKGNVYKIHNSENIINVVDNYTGTNLSTAVNAVYFICESNVGSTLCSIRNNTIMEKQLNSEYIVGSYYDHIVSYNSTCYIVRDAANTQLLRQIVRSEYSTFAYYYDPCLNDSNLCVAYMRNDNLLLNINNAVQGYSIPTIERDSSFKIFYVMKHFLIVQFKRPRIYSSSKRWTLFINTKEQRCSEVFNMDVIKHAHYVPSVDKSYIQSQYFFYILDSSALKKLFYDGTFKYIIIDIERGADMKSMYYAYDKGVSFSKDNTFVAYTFNKHLYIAQTVYPYSLNMKELPNNKKVHNVFILPDARILVNTYYDTYILQL